MSWNIDSKKNILKTYPFSVEEVQLSCGDKKIPHPYHRLVCPDWVNVLPVTSDGQVILIEQYRVGNDKTVLEIPGGVVDPHEKDDPTMAAARELEEETGFCTQRLLPLLSVNPNPATHGNRVHLFLGLDCLPAIDRKHFPDDNEDIKLRTVRVSELDELVRTGQIDHSLCCLCIMLAQKYLIKFRDNKPANP